MTIPLETAADPANLQRLVIEPLSRVEGHGKVTLLVDEDRHVRQARLHIVEFRGFERFIQGRPYWEVPTLVQRLCGICPVSHLLAASKACDHFVIGDAPVTPATERLRRLLHYGQTLQSHALHFFHLGSPDLLFGFDSEVAKRNIVGVAAEFPEIARQGVLLRRFGQEVIRVTAGKRIHGTLVVPGGVNKHLSGEERDYLLQDLDRTIAWSAEAVELVKRLYAERKSFHNDFGSFRSPFMSLVRADGAMDLYHGALRAKDERGATIFDQVGYDRYWEVLREEVKTWSYMKFPFIRSIGPENGWYRVGPLSRVSACDFIDTPLAEAERRRFKGVSGGKPSAVTMAYHWARMIELLHAIETIDNLLHDPDLQGNDLVRSGPRRNEGIAIIEAPRGTLFHHYRVNESDQVTMANLIVSTTSNNEPMNRAVESVARRFLDGQTITEGLLNHVEVAIRAYDPCLSCATHAMGKMPLVLEVVDAAGSVVDRRVRN